MADRSFEWSALRTLHEGADKGSLLISLQRCNAVMLEGGENGPLINNRVLWRKGDARCQTCAM